MTLQGWSKRTTRAKCVAVSLTCLALAGTAVAASTGYDGGYRGDTTLTRGGESVCGKTSYKTAVSVVNGQFSIVWDPQRHVGINLALQPDGSFSGSQAYYVNKTAAQLRASGHIAGNVLDASVEGDYCARSYHLTKG
jgi:hypothetical protein